MAWRRGQRSGAMTLVLGAKVPRVAWGLHLPATGPRWGEVRGDGGDSFEGWRVSVWSVRAQNHPAPSAFRLLEIKVSQLVPSPGPRPAVWKGEQ